MCVLPGRLVQKRQILILCRRTRSCTEALKTISKHHFSVSLCGGGWRRRDRMDDQDATLCL